MINKFRIISTHGLRSVFGTGWLYKGSIQLKSLGVLASQYFIYCWNAVFQNNCVEYIEDDEEQVDIETVEELPEEVNVVHLKTAAAHTQTFKQL